MLKKHVIAGSQFNKEFFYNTQLELSRNELRRTEQDLPQTDILKPSIKAA